MHAPIPQYCRKSSNIPNIFKGLGLWEGEIVSSDYLSPFTANPIPQHLQPIQWLLCMLPYFSHPWTFFISQGLAENIELSKHQIGSNLIFHIRYHCSRTLLWAPFLGCSLLSFSLFSLPWLLSASSPPLRQTPGTMQMEWLQQNTSFMG